VRSIGHSNSQTCLLESDRLNSSTRQHHITNIRKQHSKAGKRKQNLSQGNAATKNNRAASLASSIEDFADLKVQIAAAAS
jgi:hypothetical protein